MTLHTGPGCTIDSNNGGSFSGTDLTSNCDVNASGQSANAGCGISTSDSSTYGDGFNSAGGGVYATEWTTNGIAVWHFSRGSIPSDISSGNPDPSGWGLPLARFAGGSCDYGSMFQNQQIVFDITFCGDWAGNVWGSDSTCSSKAGSCTDFVGNNPSAFEQTYWEINSLKVYQQSAGSKSDANVNNAASSSAPPVQSPVPATTLETSAIAVASSTTSTLLQAQSSAAPAPEQAPPASGGPLQSNWFGSDSQGEPVKRDANASEQDAEIKQRDVRPRDFIRRHLKAHQRRSQ